MILRDKKRQAIIEAAIAEFQEQGFLGAKTTNIAKRASVSSRTLYNHFPSKEDLFDAIAEIMMARNSTMAPVPYDPDRPLKQQLSEALETYVGVITESQTIGLNRMVISELLRDLKRSQAFFSEMATHDYPITQLIADAMDAGVLRRADPNYAASQLLGLVKTFFFWPEFFLGSKQDTSGIMEDCVAMFLNHYAVET
ncbi:MAG: TetR/AcrR family transcriptional regulator [Rhodospirillaceae bacterium]|nr:TetR/AcrR family transcriptional regulator [Rhodospirillaceae bacterium]MDD9916054.1 TetR/AcrR family transcriptional regulator [Rhodospirillaceae bacterium]